MNLNQIAEYLDKSINSEDQSNILYFLEQAHRDLIVIDSELLSNVVILIGQTKRWLYPFEKERDARIMLGDIDDRERKSEIEKRQKELKIDLHYLAKELRNLLLQNLAKEYDRDLSLILERWEKLSVEAKQAVVEIVKKEKED